MNPKAETISEALGITEERRVSVTKQVGKICKDEIEEDSEEGAAGIIAKVYNAFDDDAEKAFALYILEHAENEVMIHSLFQLPESVGEEA